MYCVKADSYNHCYKLPKVNCREWFTDIYESRINDGLKEIKSVAYRLVNYTSATDWQIAVQ